MKGIEEAAIEFSGINEDQSANKAMSYNKFDIENAFIKGIEFAQRWNPVTESLPEAKDHSIDVLIKLGNGNVLTGYLFVDGDWLKYDEIGRGEVIKRQVTHWRQIELK